MILNTDIPYKNLVSDVLSDQERLGEMILNLSFTVAKGLLQ